MAIKPRVEAIPQNHSKTRVVVADIGLNEKGGINWEARICKEWKVARLPWYVVVDAQGKATTDADAAKATVEDLFK